MRISDWSSDVCSSDLGEGWHLPPAEAMACGCAVVSTDIPGVFDYALEGTTALLAPPGDSATLADRLTELLDEDRKSVVSGKSVSVRVDLGGSRIIKKKKKDKNTIQHKQ